MRKWIHRIVFLLLLGVAAGGAAPPADPVTAPHPLAVLDFYVGTIVSEKVLDVPFASEIRLEWGVGKQALRFVGTWDRDGEPPQFVSGLMGWDPVAEEIQIVGVFYHGAYFSGVVRVLDAEKRIVRREWEGRYPDGRSVPYRETWTPVSDDTFEWRIEHFRDGDWQLHLPPGGGTPAIHRVVRGAPNSDQS